MPYPSPSPLLFLFLFRSRSRSRAAADRRLRARTGPDPPARLTVPLTSRDGERTTRAIRLRDQAGEHTFNPRGSETVRVRFTVESAYGAAKDRRIAVAEVEFFGRSQ